MTLTSNQFLRHASQAAAFSVLAVLAACGGTKDEKKAGQAVATVNNAEITVHQLNAELQAMPAAADPEQRETLTKQALEALIDRQLLLAAALEAKLDRDPDVMQAIERSREQILAQSYLQRQLSATALQPTQQQLEEYFAKHPQLFSGRKLFQLQQLALAQKDYSEDLAQVVGTARSLDEVAAWLNTRNVQYARGQAQRTTADLPQPLVTKLDELEGGKPFLAKDKAQVVIATLHFIKDVPVTKEDALPQIARFLANTGARDKASSTIASLRTGAKVEYMNSAPASAKGVPAPASAMPAGAQPAAGTTAGGDSIARGVVGMK